MRKAIIKTVVSVEALIQVICLETMIQVDRNRMKGIMYPVITKLEFMRSTAMM